ncbi:hypothetical protein F6455_14940 [Proteobacteria bacterium 005FR1]|nr:hypothetical protein [Proteobacteria bacterium 005FR1]
MTVQSKFLKLLVASLMPFAFAGCAQSPEREQADVDSVLTDMALVKDRTVQSIRDYRIDGWRYVDPYNVILTAGRDEDYLVSFMTPCFGLSSAFAIGFTSTTGGVTEFDDIVVEGPGGTAEVCSIKEIVRLRTPTD